MTNTIFNDFALLASDTARTKAYIQMMVKEGLLPSKCVVYTDDFERMEYEANVFNGRIPSKYFDVNEPLLWTIRNAGLDYTVVMNKDINSKDMKDKLEAIPQKFLIYSGYGGCILREHLFHMKKKFLHVHAGILPQYRGSTTAYYSMLQENYIGATAIFLNEGIDEGEIVASERFTIVPADVNIDVVYEPYLRSQVLKKVMVAYKEKGTVYSTEQKREEAQTYYIIHPVLKHIALIRNEKRNDI